MKTALISNFQTDPKIKGFFHDFINFCENSSEFFSYYLKKKRNIKENLNIFLEVKEIECIVFFCDIYNYLDVDYLIDLKSKYKIVMYHGDVQERFDICYNYISQTADLILTAELIETYRYEQFNYNAKNLPMALDKSLANETIINKDIDVSFIGRLDRPYRKECVNFLIEKGIDVQLYGYGSKNGILNHDEMINILKRSKIVLNFTSASMSVPFFIKQLNIQRLCKVLKGRPYEGMICGALVISQESQDIKHLFTEDMIVVAKDKDEFLEKINFYLKNEKERSRIAENGKKYVLTHNTFESLFEYLNEILKGIIKTKNEKFIYDRRFKSYSFRMLLDQILRSNVRNIEWTNYCFKRIIKDLNFFNLCDIFGLFFYYVTNKKIYKNDN